MSTVLVVDDDPALARALGINLRARGYEVHTAGTGASALRLAASHPPDAVVLDLGLPDMDGRDVIAGLRGWTEVPILVLSAREQSAQKVAALDAGADDYVVKPFGMDELRPGCGPRSAAARRRRCNRRSPPQTSPSTCPPDGSPPAARTSSSLRPSGTCSKCSHATPAGWSTMAGC